MAETPNHRPRLTPSTLDHAAARFDSDYEWASSPSASAGPTRWTLPRHNAEFYAHYQAGTLDVARLRALCHRSRAPARPRTNAPRTERFMREVIAPAIRPDTVTCASAPAGGDRCSSSPPPTNSSPFPSPRRWACRSCWPCNWRATPAAWFHRRHPGHAHHARRQGAAWKNGCLRTACAGPTWKRSSCSDSMNDVPCWSGWTTPGPLTRCPPAPTLAQERGWRISTCFEAPMIKTFIDKLLGKAAKGWQGGKAHFGKRRGACSPAASTPRWWIAAPWRVVHPSNRRQL